MNRPLVTVACITYNHAKYIRDAIEGFLMQRTTFPIEIRIFDDASTDGNQEIIKEYAKKDDRIVTFLMAENQWSKGKYGLVDWLFPSAKGKYIALLEGDDYWTDPYKLQKQVDFLETNSEYGIVYTRYDTLYESENKLVQFKEIDYSNFHSGEIYEKLLKNDCIGTLTVLVRKSCLDEALKSIDNELYKWKMGDYPLWLEISKHYKIGYLNISTAVYRIHGKSISNHYDELKFLEFLFSSHDVKNFFINKYSCSKDIKREIALKLSKNVLRYNYLKPKNDIFTKDNVKQAFNLCMKEKGIHGIRFYLYYFGYLNPILRFFTKIVLSKYYKETNSEFGPRIID